MQPHHLLYPLSDGAIRHQPKRRTDLHIVPQNLVELWVVATRPVDQNGLGMTTTAEAELAKLKGMFLLLPETPASYPAWGSLVIQHQVADKPTHDARLVAAMQVHGITRCPYSPRFTSETNSTKKTPAHSYAEPGARQLGPAHCCCFFKKAATRNRARLLSARTTFVTGQDYGTFENAVTPLEPNVENK